MDEDPRLKVMRKEWFHGIESPDIGCNYGIITIRIERINNANWHLKKFVRETDSRRFWTKVQLASPNASSPGERKDIESHMIYLLLKEICSALFRSREKILPRVPILLRCNMIQFFGWHSSLVTSTVVGI